MAEENIDYNSLVEASDDDLGSQIKSVKVPKNAFPTIVLSRGSSATLDMTVGYHVNVELYKDAKFKTVGGVDKVTQKTHYL